MDDERYHRFKDILYLITKADEESKYLLSVERADLKRQEKMSRSVFKKYYEEAKLYDCLDDIKVLFALYSANYKSDFKYDALLYNTDKNETIYKKVNEKATRVQDDYENVIKNNFKEYIPKEIILPDELNIAKKYINEFENKSIKLFNNEFKNSEEMIINNIRDLAKLENKELINFIKYLQNNNYIINNQININENNIFKLIDKIKEKQR